VRGTQRVVLDTAGVATPDELHEGLKRQLGLPGYYGKNLDALWDGLTGWVDLPLTVEWRGFDAARKAVGGHVDMLLETFREAAEQDRGFGIEVVHGGSSK